MILQRRVGLRALLAKANRIIIVAFGKRFLRKGQCTRGAAGSARFVQALAADHHSGKPRNIREHKQLHKTILVDLPACLAGVMRNLQTFYMSVNSHSLNHLVRVLKNAESERMFQHGYNCVTTLSWQENR
jgi:hypothetical protein